MTGSIDRLERCDRATLDRYVPQGKPFLVPGFARDWPCCTKWTPDYLAATCRETRVPVSHYPDGKTLVAKVELTVREYIAALAATPEGWQHHYMESVALSELSDDLYRDVPMPPELGGMPGLSDTVFFGLKTGSCCHIHAHEEAVVFQLRGRKRFVLYHPDDVRNLYFERWTQDYRRSRIDFPEVDYELFPRARRLSPIEIVLEPGDVLYLPVHWAHWTAADEFTFTMTRFFDAQLRHYRFPSPGVRCVVGGLLQGARDRVERVLQRRAAKGVKLAKV